METTLLIEAEGQPSVSIVIPQEPDIIFQDAGIQGVPGPVSMPEEGDAVRVVGDVLHVDITRLTLAP